MSNHYSYACCLDLLHKYFLFHAEAQRRREEDAKKNFYKRFISGKLSAIASSINFHWYYPQWGYSMQVFGIHVVVNQLHERCILVLGTLDLPPD
ncbi:hypothetical protein H6H01_20920 [Nostoc calcicola FACHB-3891]|nr:hypothetical protein [Nostoc calcicola FACHB-3891]